MYKDEPVTRHAPVQLPNQSVAQLRTTAPHAQAQPACGIWQIPLSKLKRSFSLQKVHLFTDRVGESRCRRSRARSGGLGYCSGGCGGD